MATRLAMRIAVEMEIQAALSTRTETKAETIDSALGELAVQFEKLGNGTPVDDEARAYWHCAEIIRGR